VLEDQWKADDSPERPLWQGLAQVAVGITHALRSNESGARALLARGAETLAPFAGTAPHLVDVDGIRAWASHAEADLTLTATPPRLALPPT
jgi:hypothetical protein